MTELDKTLAEIARKHMGIETLRTRNVDSMDFHDVAAWVLRDALAEAYVAGHAKAAGDLAGATRSASAATPELLAKLDLALLHIQQARDWLLPLRLPVATECALLLSALDGLRQIRASVSGQVA